MLRFRSSSIASAASLAELLVLLVPLVLGGCSGGDFSLADPPGDASSEDLGADGSGLEDASWPPDAAADTTEDSKVADTSTLDDATVDSTVADTYVADTKVADTFVADTFVADTFVADTFVADTFVADTFVADTFVADTFVADTKVADTFVADTFVADTFVADTKVPDAIAVDGLVCPAPPSTKTWDTSTATCADIPSKLTGAVGDARRCNCDADCSRTVARNVCGCETFVNPGADAYPLAVALWERWSKLGCIALCPDILCVVPTTASCVPDPFGGGFKVCQDKSSGSGI